jgi:acetyltransferase-like isoleucine patch superfamily enzyme
MIFRKAFINEDRPYITEENIYIGPFVSVGKNTEIKPNVVIAGNVKIGENCLIAPNVSIVRGQKDWIKVFEEGKYVTEVESEKLPNVTIYDNVFIGANSVIAGIGIIDNVCVLPLSYVNKAIKLKGTYAGSPARMIKPYPIYYRR